MIISFLCGDKAMEEDADQVQLVSSSAVHLIDETITEETLLTDQQPDGEEQGIQSASLENFEWNTSLLSQVRIYAILLANNEFFLLDLS